MTDNARIVREALEDIARHTVFMDGDAPSLARAALPALETLFTDLAAAKDREAGLTKALAEVQADLERARVAGGLVLKRFEPVIDTLIFSKRMALIKLRAALAPEQKG